MANTKELQKRIRELKENFRGAGDAYKAWQQAVETQDVRRNSLYSTYRNIAVTACTSAYELTEVLDLVDAELTMSRVQEAEVKPVMEAPPQSSGYVTGFTKTQKDEIYEIEKEIKKEKNAE